MDAQRRRILKCGLTVSYEDAHDRKCRKFDDGGG
jgi:hypothetical protein